MEDHWGSKLIASRGKLTDASDIPRVIAFDKDEIVGLATYRIDSEKKECEVISIDATIPRHGVGSMLLKEVEAQAKKAECKQIWLITTNTNPEAANFYVMQGYRLVAVHLDAVDESRKLKPQIPLEDERGIPLQDEWGFSKQL